MASAQIQVGAGLNGLLKEGHKSLSGLEQAILKNIEACDELGRVTRTSMGPNGMNKLVINHLEKLFVTSDAATIMNELEVVHPAAKMLVMAAQMQESEYGDYTNFTITFAAELLRVAESLLRVGVHPAEIVIGYKKASDIVLESLHEHTCEKVNDLRDRVELQKALRSVIAAKQYGYEDFLGEKVAEACAMVIPPPPRTPSLNVDNIRVAKMLGGNILMTDCIKGMVCRRPAESRVEKVVNAKIAVFGTAIEASQTETKATVAISSAEELMQYNISEEQMLEEQIRGIKESGVNVVVSGGSISEMALHYIDQYGLLAVKVTSKWDLRRLCRTVGATAVLRLGPVMPDEMGTCDLVEMVEIAGGRCVVFSHADQARVATVVVRSSTTNQLDNLGNVINDGVNTVKTLCKDARLLPGGGATEMALANKIHAVADSTPGLEQYGIRKFAEALEVVPRVLATNAGKDPTSVVSGLYAAHQRGESTKGVDVETGGVSCMKEAGIFDAYLAKHAAFRLATDAAITILRVDQIIASKQAGGPKPPGQR
jgi:T-complex protein 1 subunit theta